MNAETFFNNGFGEDCEKVHRNHVIELMQNYAEHYYNEQLRIAVVGGRFCADCRKYKTLQGNGMIHQLCECSTSK